MTTNSSNPAERGWYLIYTKPRAEKTAQENLARQQYQVYLPFIKIQKRRQRKYVEVVEPMFPRYLFIQLNCTTDNWSPIRSTLGVSSIVRFGTYPMQVPNDLVSILMENEDQHGIQHAVMKDFRPGDRVEIIDGALSGYEGIFLEEKSKDRVTILLNIAGQHTRVSMTRHNLQFA
ncbi:MAG: transcription/translation regulatory transformer protein RfaH [Gammaproteobacteria bacterium]|nr:transcription/translation regulatory transformer protein RfaH [Gammaproteobacteria bacterium]